VAVEPAAPTILIVDDEPLNRAFVKGVLSCTPWQTLAACSGEEALALLDPAPALILMDLQLGGMGGVSTTAAIRARSDAAASVPIVAFTTSRILAVGELHLRGFDDNLPKPCTAPELLAMVDRWRPDGVAASLSRLEEAFGTEVIRDMAARYRILLGEALVALDAADRSGATGIAHRVAGISGTLGFPELGRLWLALSEGDMAAVPALRRETRRTLAALDRRG
jgi:CheY-like chemotaxis protein